MYKSYPVTFHCAEVGRAEFIEQGIYTLLSCRCSLTCSDIVRLICIHRNNCTPIGVLIPCGSCLELTKRFSKSALCALELDDNTHFEVRAENSGPPPAGWQSCHTPAELFSDPDIKSACADTHDALYRIDAEEVFLAVQLSAHKPFSLMPIFCFGTPQEIDGMDYLVFRVKNGMLIV